MKTKLRLAGIIRESIVDGPGWRFVVFAQGCTHACDGCHNPETHDLNGGYDSSVEKLINEIKKDPLLSGVTFSGGEPFLQAKEFAVFAEKVHELGLHVLCYTGFTIEQLLKSMNTENGWKQLLENTDILIDGKFIPAEKTLNLKFRGSSNQRIINPAASIKSGKAVEMENI